MSDLSLGGLATGMDTASIIEQLVQYEKLPIYRYQTEISELEQTKGAWRDINSRLDKLEGKTTDLKLSSTFNSRSASSSNEDVATASASNDSIEANYSIEVHSTAKAQRIAGIRFDDSTTAISEFAEFGSLEAENTININGADITINESDTLNNITNKINEADAGVKASIVDNHLVLEGEDTGLSSEISLIDDNNLLKDLGILADTADDGAISLNLLEVKDADTALNFNGSFQIDLIASDGTTSSTGEITVDETTTLNDLSAQISALSDLNASVVDEGNGYYSLSVSSYLTDSEIKLTDTGTDNNVLKDLSFGNRSYADELQGVSDALIDINGITGIRSSTNTFSEAVEGVTFNINPETDTSGDNTATISVSKDTGKSTKAVQAFVDQYNSVMSFIDNKTYYDDEEEKGGILQGDGTAMRLQMRLRELVTSQVKEGGDYNTLTSIGIEIDRDGVMSFDTDKFTDALKESPEEVMGLFNGESDEEGYDGMAVRLDSYLDQLMQTNTGLIPRRLDFYDTRIDNLNDDIEDVERKVEMTRERYTEQFTAMEEAISQMQSQQSWMLSQLQSLGGSSSLLSSM